MTLLSPSAPNINAVDDCDNITSDKVIASATPKDPQTIRSLLTNPLLTIWNGSVTVPPLNAVVADDTVKSPTTEDAISA